MRATQMLLTKEVAEGLLKLNTNNRPANKVHVEFLAREMAEGRWTTNGDTICLSNSRLIDGQHRIMASLKAGVPIPILLVEDVEDTAFNTKDTNRRNRYAGDVLACEGMSDPQSLASAASLAYRYLNGNFKGNMRVPSTMVTAFVAQNREAMMRSLTFFRAVGSKSFFRPALVIALHFVLSEKTTHKDRVEEFISNVLVGECLTATDPAYMLRERLVARMDTKKGGSGTYRLALCIKAWNLMVTGTTVARLVFLDTGSRAEEYPMPL